MKPSEYQGFGQLSGRHKGTVLSFIPLISADKFHFQDACSHSENVGIILSNNPCVVAHYLTCIFLFNSVSFESIS